RGERRRRRTGTHPEARQQAAMLVRPVVDIGVAALAVTGRGDPAVDVVAGRAAGAVGVGLRGDPTPAVVAGGQGPAVRGGRGGEAGVGVVAVGGGGDGAAAVRGRARHDGFGGLPPGGVVGVGGGPGRRVDRLDLGEHLVEVVVGVRRDG